MSTSLTLVLSEAQAENAVQLLDESQVAKLDMMVSEVHEITVSLSAGPLASAADAGRVNDLLGRAAKASKELEALRVSRVKPLNREVQNVNALFAPLTDALETLTYDAKKLLVAWKSQEASRAAREAEEARLRQEEAARAEAEALSKGDMAQAAEASLALTRALLAEPEAPVTGFKSDHATTTTRGRWVFQVVQPDLVPREYLEPAVQKIRAAVAAGVREIPGVSITQEDQVVVRSR